MSSDYCPSIVPEAAGTYPRNVLKLGYPNTYLNRIEKLVTMELNKKIDQTSHNLTKSQALSNLKQNSEITIKNSKRRQSSCDSEE